MKRSSCASGTATLEVHGGATQLVQRSHEGGQVVGRDPNALQDEIVLVSVIIDVLAFTGFRDAVEEDPAGLRQAGIVGGDSHTEARELERRCGLPPGDRRDRVERVLPRRQLNCS